MRARVARAMEEQGRRANVEREQEIQSRKQRLLEGVNREGKELTAKEIQRDTWQLNFYEQRRLWEEKEKIRRQKYDAAVLANEKPDHCLAG